MLVRYLHHTPEAALSIGITLRFVPPFHRRRRWVSRQELANLRRIHRYQQAKMEVEEQQKKAAERQRSAQEGVGISIFSFSKAILAAFLGQLQPQRVTIGW